MTGISIDILSEKIPLTEREEKYLNAEKEAKAAAETEAYTEKTENYHRWAAFKGYCKANVLGIVLGVTAGVIAFGFLSLAGVPLLAPIGAAFVSVGIAMWFIKKGVEQVAKENKASIDYGKTTFRSLSTAVFAEIKQGLKVICGKSEKIEKAFPVLTPPVEAVNSSVSVTHENLGRSPTPTPIPVFSHLNSRSEKSTGCFSFFFSRNKEPLTKSLPVQDMESMPSNTSSLFSPS